MKATIVAYELRLDEESGELIFCNTAGMQPAGWPRPGTWWTGAGPVPHPEFSGDHHWRWIAFANVEDAQADADEARRQGHSAVIIGERDVFRRPWGWGTPAVTAGVRRSMIACDSQLEPPERGYSVIVA
jgi:hypothetical protein